MIFNYHSAKIENTTILDDKYWYFHVQSSNVPKDVKEKSLNKGTHRRTTINSKEHIVYFCTKKDFIWSYEKLNRGQMIDALNHFTPDPFYEMYKYYK